MNTLEYKPSNTCAPWKILIRLFSNSVCRRGMFNCTYYPCPAVCTVYGDRHYHSFDGLEYDYISDCQVFLIKVCHSCYVVWLLSLIWLFATPWSIARQAPLSMGFPRQEYWSRLPFPSPGDLPHPGIKPRSPALQAVFFYHWATWAGKPMPQLLVLVTVM